MTDPRTQVDPGQVGKLLAKLVDIYSPSGKEEEIVDWLHGALKRSGLPVRRQAVEDRRHNLVVLPADVESLAVLVGHVDTVPAFDLDEVEARQEGDRISGLGAADMKAGCAAMIEAYRLAWRALDGRVPAALALVVGEEEDGDGAAALVDELQVPWAIIGEPTDLTVCPASFGYLELQLTSHGQRMHASLARGRQGAVGAILEAARRLIRHLEDSHPEVVVNVRDVFSARAGFAVPERCEAWFDLHAPPEVSLETLVAGLEELVAQGASAAGPRPTLRLASVEPGYQLPDRGPLLDALRRVFQARALVWEPEPFRSHSDANQLWRAGIRPVVLGPGQLARAHAPGESVALSQVVEAARIYLDVLLHLAGTETGA